jgi:hypothetical protein
MRPAPPSSPLTSASAAARSRALDAELCFHGCSRALVWPAGRGQDQGGVTRWPVEEQGGGGW